MDAASTLHVSEGAGILDVDDDDDDFAEGSISEFSTRRDSDYEEEQQDEDDEDEGSDAGENDIISDCEKGEEEEERVIRKEGAIYYESMDEDLLEEDEDYTNTTSNEQTNHKVDNCETDGQEEDAEENGEEEKQESILENEEVLNEQEADDAILALAAAQQNESIIPQKITTPQAASGVIKRQAYDFLMNNNYNSNYYSGEKYEKYIKSIDREQDDNIVGKEEQEVVESQSPPIISSPYYSAEQVTTEEEEQEKETEKESQSDINIRNTQEKDKYNDYSGDSYEDDVDKEYVEEEDGMGNFFSFLTNNKTSTLSSPAIENTLQTTISPLVANTKEASTSPSYRHKPLPTSFSSHVIHNYERVYSTRSSDDYSIPPPTPPSPPKPPQPQPQPFIPSNIVFPEDKSASDESLSALREMDFPPSKQAADPNTINPTANTPPSPDDYRLKPPVNAKDSCSFSSAFQQVHNKLGGQDAEIDIDKAMNSLLLKTRVQMLREATKNLRCAALIDILFKDPEKPVNPSDKDLNKLKNIIAAELTMNEFLESVKLTDATSAELFRESNEKIEFLLRKKIMCNPLFAEAYTSTPIINSKITQGPTFLEDALLEQAVTNNYQQQQNTDEENQELPINNPPPQTTYHRNRYRVNLHMELFKILKPDAKFKSNINRLSERITFLNRLIEYKVATSITWLRLVNLMGGLISDAANVIFGDHDQEQEQKKDIEVTETTTLSAQLKLKSTESAPSTKESDTNMSCIGVELVFGAAADFLEKHISMVCADIGTLAVYLHIPIVLLSWPREFTVTPSYKSLLLDSISYFSSKITVPAMYIIDAIMFNDKTNEEPEENEEEMQTADGMSLFSDKDKKKVIKTVFNNMLSGQNGEGDVLKSLFNNDNNNNSNNNNKIFSAAYIAGASIIDHKTPLFESILSGVVDYMDKRKHLLSAAMIKILRRAKLSIGIYCVKYKLKKASKKTKRRNRGKMAPMQNLMYRPPATSSLPPILTATTATTTSDNTNRCYNEKSSTASSFIHETPSASVLLKTHRSLPHKRPNTDLLASRMKRLKQYQFPVSVSSTITTEDDDGDDDSEIE